MNTFLCVWQFWFNFNIIDFMENCHIQYRNTKAKFKCLYYID